MNTGMNRKDWVERIWSEWRSGRSYLSYLVKDVIGLVLVECRFGVSSMEVSAKGVFFVHRRDDGAMIYLRTLAPVGENIYFGGTKANGEKLGNYMIPMTIDTQVICPIPGGLLFKTKSGSINAIRFRLDFPGAVKFTSDWVSGLVGEVISINESHVVLKNEGSLQLYDRLTQTYQVLPDSQRAFLGSQSLYLQTEEGCWEMNLSTQATLSIPRLPRVPHLPYRRDDQFYHATVTTQTNGFDVYTFQE